MLPAMSVRRFASVLCVCLFATATVVVKNRKTVIARASGPADALRLKPTAQGRRLARRGRRLALSVDVTVRASSGLTAHAVARATLTRA